MVDSVRALCVALLTGASTTAMATVIANHVIETYPIVGSTAQELRSQMSALGPSGSGGRYDGYTNWNIE